MNSQNQDPNGSLQAADIAALRIAIDDVSARILELESTQRSTSLDFKTTSAILDDFEVKLQAVVALAESSCISPDHYARLEQGMRDLTRHVYKARVDLGASKPVPVSTLSAIGRSILRIATGAIVGAVCGGPAIALLASDPIMSKAIEGLASGAIATAGTEVGNALTASRSDHHAGVAADAAVARAKDAVDWLDRDTYREPEGWIPAHDTEGYGDRARTDGDAHSL